VKRVLYTNSHKHDEDAKYLIESCVSVNYTPEWCSRIYNHKWKLL